MTTTSRYGNGSNEMARFVADWHGHMIAALPDAPTNRVYEALTVPVMVVRLVCRLPVALVLDAAVAAEDAAAEALACDVIAFGESPALVAMRSVCPLIAASVVMES